MEHKFEDLVIYFDIFLNEMYDRRCYEKFRCVFCAHISTGVDSAPRSLFHPVLQSVTPEGFTSEHLFLGHCRPRGLFRHLDYPIFSQVGFLLFFFHFAHLS